MPEGDHALAPAARPRAPKSALTARQGFGVKGGTVLTRARLLWGSSYSWYSCAYHVPQIYMQMILVIILGLDARSLSKRANPDERQDFC